MPLIRFRPWRYINLFTYLLTYYVSEIENESVGETSGTFCDVALRAL